MGTYKGVTTFDPTGAGGIILEDNDKALADKCEAAELHAASTSNPHSTTYTQVGAAATNHTHTSISDRFLSINQSTGARFFAIVNNGDCFLEIGGTEDFNYLRAYKLVESDPPVQILDISIDGTIKFLALPTIDPVNEGQLWNNNGVLNISAG